MNTKQEVQSRRMAAVYGVVGGILLFVMVKWTGLDLRAGESYRSLFFGDAEHWPDFVKQFTPLDLAFTCLYFWLIMRLIIAGPGAQETDQTKAGVKYWILYGLGIFIVGGSIGGVLGTSMGGWYTSLEFFLGMGAFSLILIAGVFLLLGVSLGIGYLAKSAWAHVRTTRAAQPFLKLGRYLNADDVNGEGSHTTPPLH